MTDVARQAVAVIPTYNERANLPLLVAGIRQHAPGMHILFVDDNSPDGTGAAAEDLSQQFPGEVSVLHRAGKAGLGKARRRLHAGPRGDYEYIMLMDADLSHDPSHLPAFLRQCRTTLSSARATSRESAS